MIKKILVALLALMSCVGVADAAYKYTDRSLQEIGLDFYEENDNSLCELNSELTGDVTQVATVGGWDLDGSDDFDGDDFDELVTILDNRASAGRLWGGTLSDAGGGKVNIAAGAGLIKIGESSLNDYALTISGGQASRRQLVTWDAIEDFPVAGVGYNLVYWDASAGEFAVQLKENFYANFDFTSDFTIGRIHYDGYTVVARLCGMNLWNFDRRVQMFGEERFPVERAFGMMIGATGTRNFSLSAGVIWAELVNRFPVNAFDSSTGGTFTYWYRSGAPNEWLSTSGNTQISNVYYDDGDGTLGEVGATPLRYGVHWVYECHDSSVHVVYGQGSYTLTQAQNATVPATLPSLVGSYSTLVGKIIIARNATSFTSIQSPFTTQFAYASASNHNDLGGLQGGTTNEYYHLTAAQANDIQLNSNLTADTTQIATVGGWDTTASDDLVSADVVLNADLTDRATQVATAGGWDLDGSDDFDATDLTTLTSDITTSANIYGTYFIGNGSLLTNLPTDSVFTETNDGAYLDGDVSITQNLSVDNINVRSIAGAGSGNATIGTLQINGDATVTGEFAINGIGESVLQMVDDADVTYDLTVKDGSLYIDGDEISGTGTPLVNLIDTNDGNNALKDLTITEDVVVYGDLTVDGNNIIAFSNGAVDGEGKIYQDGDLIINLTSDGANKVTLYADLTTDGTVTADAFVGDGSGLTGISSFTYLTEDGSTVYYKGYEIENTNTDAVGVGGTGAHTGDAFVVVSLADDLTNERTLAVQSDRFVLTDSGANAAYTIGIKGGYDLPTLTQIADWITVDDLTPTGTLETELNHDNLTGFVANEHIDWTSDQGATNIHSGNYTDTNTTYTAGWGLVLTDTTFSASTHLTDGLVLTADTTAWDKNASDDFSTTTLQSLSTPITTSNGVWSADLAYGVGWNGRTQLPTMNAVYDEMETKQDIVTEGSLADSVIVSADIKDGTITGADIADGGIGHADIATDAVGADELSATGVEAELEAVLDLAEMQGEVTTAQLPDNITTGLVLTSDTSAWDKNASDDLALGATSVTAFRGDYGTTAYNHSQDNTQGHSDYLLNNEDDTTSGGIWTADLAYGAGWNGRTQVPTMNAVYDKIETLGAGYTNLTSFVDQTAWRVFYSNTDGDVTELALGADGTYLKSNGASSAPTWATPTGASIWTDTNDGATIAQDLTIVGSVSIGETLAIDDDAFVYGDLTVIGNNIVAFSNGAVDGEGKFYQDTELIMNLTSAGVNKVTLYGDLTISESLTIDEGLFIGEGKLKDSVIVSADIKDGEVGSTDLADGTGVAPITFTELASTNLTISNNLSVANLVYTRDKMSKPIFSVNINSPTTSFDDIKKKLTRPITVTAIYAFVTGGTSVEFTIGAVDSDGNDSDIADVNGANLTASAGTQLADTSFSGTTTLLADEWIQMDTVAVTGAVTNISVTVYGYET